ncbi:MULTISPECIES: AEC family transporter [unclassified Acinetobacter]|uniref:AEC family transporter n=1 Tax=unclassified Acinetobacter TaxID=196816 RepID=UPI0029344361|nr:MULTISPECIES: AEC family transporter [unclassified Acinetobacter]WOE31436.1 AEC family transporter [Acinetobacter sp. SAAs470]WOE39632.1 AEC family transporter [Acinetobacter sp. SAAs474]
MLHIILSAMGPIIVGLAIGFICGKKKYFTPDTEKAFADFVVKIALPAALFVSAATVSPSILLNVDYFLSLAAGLILTFILGLIIAKFIFKHNRHDGTMQALTMSFPDMAYCGPPVLLATVGSSGLIAMVMGNIIYTVIIIPIAMLLLSEEQKKQSIWQAVAKSVSQPLVVLPILGAVVAISGIKLPQVLYASVDELGKCAGGVALFFLGLMISHIKLKINFEMLCNLFVKNILQAAIILMVAIALGLEGGLLKSAFIIGILPTATAVPALAMSYKAYEEDAAAAVFLSTLCSLVTIVLGIIIIEMWL